MAVYRCLICGTIFDEAKEGKKFSELRECPVCHQDVANFEKISDDAPASGAPLPQAWKRRPVKRIVSR